jgi:Lon protease-like protein
VSSRRRLPLFPLSAVVFLPETTLPLHVFEPRYRELLRDALEGERIIGVQLLDTSAPPDDTGRPVILPVGCAGRVVEHEPLPDGRSNILLRGLFRYRVEEEVPAGKPYRVAEVTPLAVEPLPDPPAAPAAQRRLRLLSDVGRLADAVGRPQAKELPDDLSEEGLVNEILMRLGVDAEDGYRLLAMDRLEERYEWAEKLVASMRQRLDLLAPFRTPAAEPRWN